MCTIRRGCRGSSHALFSFLVLVLFFFFFFSFYYFWFFSLPGRTCSISSMNPLYDLDRFAHHVPPTSYSLLPFMSSFPPHSHPTQPNSTPTLNCFKTPSRVFDTKYTPTSTFIMSGSDDGNIRFVVFFSLSFFVSSSVFRPFLLLANTPLPHLSIPPPSPLLLPSFLVSGNPKPPPLSGSSTPEPVPPSNTAPNSPRNGARPNPFDASRNGVICLRRFIMRRV